MKRRLKKGATLYAHLNATGVLEAGDEQSILQARKDYWRAYKRTWRQNKRKEDKEFTLSFNAEELKELRRAAKEHHRNITPFIKQATFAYLNKRYLVLDPDAVNKIRQLLAMNLNLLQDLIDANVMSHKVGADLVEQFSLLERKVLIQLHNPPLLP